jgi:hypothetical protein
VLKSFFAVAVALVHPLEDSRLAGVADQFFIQF